jgi:predicted metal-binding protein
LPEKPVLHVCVTCRAGEPLESGQVPPGRHLFEAVQSALGADPVAELHEVACLSSCEAGCAAAISQPGKWTYLLGRLEPSLVPDLLTYAASYAAHRTGTVLPSKRPATLARMILGRMPDLGHTELAA